MPLGHTTNVADQTKAQAMRSSSTPASVSAAALSSVADIQKTDEMSSIMSSYKEASFTCNDNGSAKKKARKVERPFDALPSVSIDPGTQKYVLIEIFDQDYNDDDTDNDDGNKYHRYLVRGLASASYHADAADATIRTLRDLKVPFEVLGGGRIRHDTAKKHVIIYGHSYGFPWRGEFRHDLAAIEVRKALGTNYTVETSNEGY